MSASCCMQMCRRASALGGRGNDRSYMQKGEQRDRRLENMDVRRGRERGDRTGGGQKTGSPSGSWRSRSDSSVRVSSLTRQTVPLWFGSQAQGRGTLSGFDCSGAGECVLMPACAQRTKKIYMCHLIQWNNRILSVCVGYWSLHVLSKLVQPSCRSVLLQKGDDQSIVISLFIYIFIYRMAAHYVI